MQLNPKIIAIHTEKCYHIELNDDKTTSSLATDEILQWILKRPQQTDGLKRMSTLNEMKSDRTIAIEIGPRFNFSTAQSTNSVSICQNVGLTNVKRLEVSVTYLLSVKDTLSSQDVVCIYALRLTKLF